jgi:hypothetical protein
MFFNFFSSKCKQIKNKKQSGASMIEALIALPIVLVACLLTLQMMLLYRAKISLNHATQEAARIGAMSNGRVVPRFLTDVARFSTVFRKKPKCVNSSGLQVPNTPAGGCPAGSNVERHDPNVNTATIPGANTTADGQPPTGPQFNGNGGNTAAPPPPLPNSGQANAAMSSNQPSFVKQFMGELGRGMMRYGDSSVLQGFINGIMPLYTTGTSVGSIFEAQAKAYGDAMMNSCIIYHSPTQAAFIDFGFVEIDGPDRMILQIPNDLLRYRIPADLDPSGKGINYHKRKGKFASDEEGGLRGMTSSMSVQEATLLSIEIKYSYPLQVPIAREIMVGLAKLTNFGAEQTAMGQAFDNNSLNNGRWPMSSFATYRMQTPVHWHIFYPIGDATNIDTSAYEPFDGIKAAWNAISDKVNDTFDPSEPQVGFCPGLLLNITDDSLTNTGIKDNRWVGKDYDLSIR